MSGRFSKRKGKGAEYALRDHFMELGYQSKRILLSGGIKGMPGDVSVTNEEGITKLAEVKWRATEYKHVYALLDNLKIPIKIAYNDCWFIASYNFNDLGIFSTSGNQYKVLDKKTEGQYKLALNKIVKVREFLKNANDEYSDFLVLKINHKPFIFIKYIKTSPYAV